MAIIRDKRRFDDYLLGTLPGLVPSEVKARYPNDKTGQINTVLGKNPLLFDRYLSDAIEVDVDALCDGDDVFICGIMEHIEEAGIHSGDSACSLPPALAHPDTVAELERRRASSPWRSNVGGLMNVQYAIKDGEIYVLEVNPRASRTVPFVAKVIGRADRQDRGAGHGGRKPLASFALGRRRLDHVGVKEAVFPFARFPGVDTVLGPGNALDRRGHGPRSLVSRSLSPRASSAAGTQGADERHGFRLGARCRQAPHARAA